MINQDNIDILIKWINYLIADIDSYHELTAEERSIISQEVFDKITMPTPRKQPQSVKEHFAVVIKNPDNTVEVISVCEDDLGNPEPDFDRVNSIIKEDKCIILGVFKSTSDADDFIDVEGLIRAY